MSLKKSLLEQGMKNYNAAGNRFKSTGGHNAATRAGSNFMASYDPAGAAMANQISANAWKNWTPAKNVTEYQKRIDDYLGIKEPTKPKTPSGLTKEKPKTTPRQPAGQQGNAYSGQSTIKPPQYIDYNTTEAAAQNALALGMQQGDHRYQTKSLSRPGFSQGKGQEFQGALNASENMNKAAAQAADIRSQDQLANSRMKSDYEKATEQEAQSQAMFQHALSQSNWAKNFAEQSKQAQLDMAKLQSDLQLKLLLMR